MPIGAHIKRKDHDFHISPPSSWQSPQHHMEMMVEHPWYNNLSIITDTISFATHAFFRSVGAVAALMPSTTGAVSSPMGLSNDSLPVKIKVDGIETYLADSMQFFLELGCRVTRKPAYYLMPTYRAEDVDDRHLNEFYHAEVEIFGSLDDIINLAEKYVLYVTACLLEECPDSIEKMAGTTEHLSSLLTRGAEFPRIRFSKALEILEGEQNAFELTQAGLPRITATGEQALIKKFGDFFWLTHLPWKTVPFYQAKNPDNTEESLSADLLAGIGEILGSGARAETALEVENNLQEQDVSKSGYEWYCTMKEKWPAKTSGFGMGIERYILWATKHNDIRDCTPLLREFKLLHTP